MDLDVRLVCPTLGTVMYVMGASASLVSTSIVSRWTHSLSVVFASVQKALYHHRLRMVFDSVHITRYHHHLRMVFDSVQKALFHYRLHYDHYDEY